MAIFQIDIPGLFGQVSQDDLRFLASTKAKIMEHLGDPFFGSSELAQSLGLSVSQQSRRFRQLTTFSPAKMIRYFRMEYAMVLLVETQMPIKEITHLTGFHEQANFCRTFKKHFQLNPSDIRAQKTPNKSSFTFQCHSPMREEDLEYILWLSNERPWLGELLSLVLASIDEEQFNPDQLAALLSLSTSQLNRKLNALIGISASRLIKNIRLQQAAELLLYEEHTVSAIAHKVGFFDHPHFCRIFKSAYQSSPKAFRMSRSQEAVPRFTQHFSLMHKTDK